MPPEEFERKIKYSKMKKMKSVSLFNLDNIVSNFWGSHQTIKLLFLNIKCLKMFNNNNFKNMKYSFNRHSC